MKLYFASDSNKIDFLVQNNVSNILLAYPIKESDIKQCKKHNMSLFVDSGAYSVSTGKKKIKHTDYIDFIKRAKPDLYASLDVIGDPKASKINLLKEVKAGLNPIPTYHQGEPIELLEYYIDNFSYISLGGMVGTSSNKLKIFLDKAWSKIAKKRMDIKIHAFGNLGNLLKDYPFYSADGTHWLYACIVRAVAKFDNKRQGIKFNYPLTTKVGRQKSKNSWEQLATTFEEDDGRLSQSVQAYKDYEYFLTDLWSKRGVVWNG